MKLRTLLILIFCNLIWAVNPTVTKALFFRYSPEHAAWLRYVSAFVAYVLLMVFFRCVRKPSSNSEEGFVSRASPKHWFLLIMLGVLTFCLTPLLYMHGLSASLASEGAMLVVMEPLTAVLLAWLFLGERIGLSQLFVFALSIVGFVLLSEVKFGSSFVVFDAHLLGNLAIVAAILGEGAYSVIGRKLVSAYSPFSVFGVGLAIGVVFLSVAVFFSAGVPDFTGLTLTTVLAVLWIGPVATTFGYFYWMKALKESTVAGVVLTLFVQPVVGALCGYLFLGEHLSITQMLGGAVMLAAVLAQSLVPELR